MYIVFDTQAELDAANVRWMSARATAGVCDCKQGVSAETQITERFEVGRIMLDGRIACEVPPQWSAEFKDIVGTELALTAIDFPEVIDIG